MPAKSLLELAQQAAVRCVKEIDNFGDVPYKLVRPVITKIENPHQLHTIEANNPGYEGQNTDKWTEFIKRDIPGWDQGTIYPKDGRSWYKLYCKLRRRAEKEEEESAKMLTAQLNELTAMKAENVARIDLSMKHSDRKTKKPIAAPSNWRKGPAYNHRMMITPTHSLNHKPRQIMQAPSSFVEEAKRKREPQSLPQATTSTGAARSHIRPSSNLAQGLASNMSLNATPLNPKQGTSTVRPRPAGSSARQNSSQISLTEREARLKALTSDRSGETQPFRPNSMPPNQETDRRKQSDEHTTIHDPSSFVRASRQIVTRPSDVDLELARPSSPPATPKRRKEEKGDEPKSDNVKRCRVEGTSALGSSKDPVCTSHSETLSPAQLVGRDDEASPGISGTSTMQEAPVLAGRVPTTSKVPLGKVRPRGTRPPSQPLLRKKRPISS